MSNKIYKNFQVNVGIPFPIMTPITYQPPVRQINIDKINDEQEEQLGFEELAVKKLEKAKIEAEMILKEAQFEAEDIVLKTAEEAEQLKQQVLEQAKMEGYNQGIEDAQHEYDKLLFDAQEIKNQAGLEYKQVLSSLEDDAINTILDIAKKVISHELNTNKENIMFMVRDAFEKCAKDRKANLKLSDSDYEYVCERKNELDVMLERSADTDIKKDLSLKEGGCVIETSYGSIDASAQTKMDIIEQDFLRILEE